jgi:hypothetical protein
MMTHDRSILRLKGLILFGSITLFPLKSLSNDKCDDYVLNDFRAQYIELSQAITQNSVLSKKASCEEEKICDRQALIFETDKSPLDVVIRRTEALILDLSSRHKGFNGKHYLSRLSKIKKAAAQAAQAPGLSKTSANEAEGSQTEENLFIAASLLRREAVLANPEIDFDTLLFAGVVKAGGTVHMCDQYLAKNAQNGGGIYLLTGVKSGKTSVVDLLKDNKVVSGAFAGKTLSGGAALSPDLSFDGKTIAFAWTNETDKCYHIFKMGIDGSNLIQLTEGKYVDNGRADASHNDFDPCFLPSGRIAFISERRGGYGRCHPRNVPTYTLYSMKDDGSDIVCISFHETNEWHPSVSNSGQIVYTRWDYLDRDDCIAHHIWFCNPDGCNPRAYHGNYPLPQTTLEGANWSDGRSNRPFGEWNIRAIPGSTKYVATASGHHAHSFGQLILIDVNKQDDNKMSQVTGITTSQTKWSDTDGPYGTAWPLSEGYYLCNYNSSIVLVDKSGNREVLYTASGSARPIDPIPLQARTKPPNLVLNTWQGERSGLPEHKRATLGVMNVYAGDLPLGTTSGIKAMRIVQVFPQFTPLVNQTRIGYASESLARMSLGTVPVEADGSVNCEAPVGKEIYFQLLDEKGRAVQSMRAGAFVHPGEQLTCIGCHEDKWSSPPVMPAPAAFQRAPSKIEPEAGGPEPINFYRLVKPVLDDKCLPCHKTKTKAPDLSYQSLSDYAFWWPGPGTPYVNGDIVTAKHGGSRTIPGKFGAIASSLITHLEPTHNKVNLTDAEKRRITLWLDCNSNELGAYTKTTEQKNGQLIWPELDCDPKNPIGVETDRPLSGTAAIQKKLASFLGITQMARVFASYDQRGKTLTLHNLQSGSGFRISLFDASGRQLWGCSVLAASGNNPIVVRSVPHFGSGLVIVKIESSELTSTVRLMAGQTGL